MRKAKSQCLLPTMKEVRLIHGGEYSKGVKKEARPIALKETMHFTLRSSLAKGNWSFLSQKHASFIRHLVPKLAKEYNVRLYEWSQNSNHLHLLLMPKTKEGLKKFLMVLSSKIAMRITGSKKGKPFGRRFFDFIPFSRIVKWGRAFKSAKAYVVKNTLEASGEISYTKGRLRLLRRASPLPNLVPASSSCGRAASCTSSCGRALSCTGRTAYCSPARTACRSPAG